MKNLNKPLVSVWCAAYNHEKYIHDCLESFINQKTNFPFEIIVHDDASTDKTQEIIKNFEHQNRGLFNNVYQTENQFKKSKTLIPILSKISSGKYIALCDGDDYWTDPLKLQKQVDYLEANPHLSFCFHRIREENPDGSFVNAPLPPHNNRNIFSIDDLARSNFVYTASVMFQREFMGIIPDYFSQLSVGDYPLWLLLASKGDFGYINENMAVYRRGVGMWSGQDRVQMLLKWSSVLTELEKVYLNKEIVIQNLVDQQLTIITELFEKISGKEFSLLSKDVSFSQQMYSLESLIVELKQNDLRTLGIKHIVKQLLIKIKARIFKT